MNIRGALKRDVAIITDFNLRLARETEDLALDPATVRQGVEALLEDSAKGVYFVAELSESGQASALRVEGSDELESARDVVGQLMITYEWSDWRNGNIWWIQSVYVKDEFRGLGIFQALFAHVERLARETPGVCALRLYMDKHNDRARRAYHKLGMKESEYVVFEKPIGVEKPG